MIWSTIKLRAWQLRGLFLIATSVSGLVLLGGFTSVYESYELSTLDLWFRLRYSEEEESRIAVVNIGESDIRALNEWPISDEKLTDLLESIIEQQPRAIGLDIYRDLPQGDILGQERLKKLFTANPQIIGVEKAVGEEIRSSPTLRKLGQTAMADLVIDRDSRIRRGLMSVRTTDGKIVLGLATRLALMYLAEENIYLQATEDEQERVFLGKASFSSISKNEGAYVNADVGGYQVILNWRGGQDKFIHTSLEKVLKREISPDFFEDKIVLIGSTAHSLNDFFYTPYSSYRSNLKQMSGVYIHSNLASQIISSALDGRTSIKGIPETGEWFLVVIWSFIGAGSGLIFLEKQLLERSSLLSFKSITFGIIIPACILFGTNYSLFLTGLWLPTIAPCLSLLLSAIAINSYYHQGQTKLAFTDGLTQIANRHFFDRYLQQKLLHCQKSNQDLVIILCDVDFFKQYNDTYGHQAGDKCLVKVAQTVQDCIRESDLAARYGGEEFVVVLPNVDSNRGVLIADRIRSEIANMQISHESSQVSSVVSVSCGISSLRITQATSSEELIAHADSALYKAKQQGRDRAVLAEPKEVE